MTDEDFERIRNTPVVPEADYGYMFSPWYDKAGDEFLKVTSDEAIYIVCKNLGLLRRHLIEINERAFEMEEKLAAEIAAKEGVDGELKKRDQLGWVGRINNIKSKVREIIGQQLISVPTDRLCVDDIDPSIIENYKE
ncbi:MAG: TnpV protein [Clostridiales bacterium]|nr:TnpV protein [Clostridiales bacterium]